MDSRDGSYCRLVQNFNPMLLELSRTALEFGSRDLVRDRHIRLAFAIMAPHNWLVFEV